MTGLFVIGVPALPGSRRFYRNAQHATDSALPVALLYDLIERVDQRFFGVVQFGQLLKEYHYVGRQGRVLRLCNDVRFGQGIDITLLNALYERFDLFSLCHKSLLCCSLFYYDS
jgi:hypothetical protein